MARVPRIGSLRRQVIILNPVRTKDAGGGSSVTYVGLATVWAAIRTPSGNEQFDDGQQQQNLRQEIWIRARTDVESNMRLRVDGSNRIMRIHAVRQKQDGRNQWTVLDCVEVASDETT